MLQVNQVGTVTEAIEVVKQAKDKNWGVVVSHRSGETNDSFISDFAVGIGAGQIKAGAPYCGEHISKYNQVVCNFFLPSSFMQYFSLSCLLYCTCVAFSLCPVFW